MSLPVAFWDASALIPLCVQQVQTPQARKLYMGFGIAVWWATPVEIMSGLSRLKRMGEIGDAPFQTGKQRAQALEQLWDSVNPAASIAAQACSLLEVYPLRAADALQLAAALDCFDQSPRGHVFITADERLSEAARRAGFSVEFI